VDVSVKANFRSLGKRFGKSTPAVAEAITQDADLPQRLRQGPPTSVDVPGIGVVELEPDDVIITETPREGWAVASGSGETVALDLHITDELRRAGLAREVVRVLQEARKSAGLDVSDRISVQWTSDNDDLTLAIREHMPAIAAEVLATDYTEESDPQGSHIGEQLDLGLRYSLSRV
jgi:isoleucyl-tRNA synthetase